MTIRKGKLNRICKCGNTFEPEGKRQEICKPCKKESNRLRNIKRIKTLRKNIKLKKQ